eukprot:29085-Pelagococcus_subviridis.AAC.9
MKRARRVDAGDRVTTTTDRSRLAPEARPARRRGPEPARTRYQLQCRFRAVGFARMALDQSGALFTGSFLPLQSFVSFPECGS